MKPRKPIRKRSREYLAWVRTLPCIITGRIPTVPHHQDKRYHKAMGMKCSDFRAVPLSVELHTAYHDRLSWKLYEMHNIDIESVINNLNERFRNERYIKH